MRLDTISHGELLSLWKRGLRNGSLRRMPRIKRGLFSAALEYARMTGAIVNQKLVEMVRAIAVRIGLGLGRRIFFHGLGRVSAFLRNIRLMCIFAVIEKWINDDTYTFWLGTNMLVNKKSWLWVQLADVRWVQTQPWAAAPVSKTESPGYSPT